MKIESIKELEALMKLCRKQGVQSITVDGIVLCMGDEPEKQGKAVSGDEGKPMQDFSQYTPEEIATWSSAPTEF